MPAAQITGIPLLDWFFGLLEAYGYLIVFLATILENTFIVGSVVPGETIVLAAGFVASTGALNPVGVWFASLIGTVVGSNISYMLGLRGGRAALERYGHRFFISEKRLLAAEEYFAVHGSKTVLFARFAAGVKNFVPMLAGVSRMPAFWFELYTILGAAIYTTVMVALGFFFGDNFQLLLTWVKRAGTIGLVVLAVVIVAALWGRRRYIRHRDEELVEQASIEQAVASEHADDPR